MSKTETAPPEAITKAGAVTGKVRCADLGHLAGIWDTAYPSGTTHPTAGLASSLPDGAEARGGRQVSLRDARATQGEAGAGRPVDL